jgi:hypothetical protein
MSSSKQDIISRAVTEMNETHAVASIQGKTVIVTEQVNPESGKVELLFSSVADFHNMLANSFITVGIRRARYGWNIPCVEPIKELFLCRQRMGMSVIA